MKDENIKASCKTLKIMNDNHSPALARKGIASTILKAIFLLIAHIHSKQIWSFAYLGVVYLRSGKG